MKIISVREELAYAKKAIAFFQKHWGGELTNMIYEDCITHCLSTSAPLPQWYLLVEDDEIIGGIGLGTNDFISRMDLWPWLVALYIEEKHRGHAYGKRLIDRVEADAKSLGYDHLYLSTHLENFYETYGYSVIGPGYHPWGESSTIYGKALE